MFEGNSKNKFAFFNLKNVSVANATRARSPKRGSTNFPSRPSCVRSNYL